MNRELNYDLQLFAEDQQGAVSSETESKPAENAKVKFSPEQQIEVDRIIQSRLAREMDKWKTDAQKKADDEKEAREANRLKSLSESERTAQRIKDMEAKLAALESEKKETAMMSAARDELQKKGYAFSDSIVKRLVGSTAEETKSAIDEFSAEFDQAVKAAVKKALPSAEPKGSRTRSESAPTKSDIMAIKDKRERQKAIRENMNLFK